MAHRYGGKYSPGGDNAEASRPGPYDGARVDPVGARCNLLLVPPVVLAVLSLDDGATGLAAGLAGAALLGLGAWLLRDGLRAEAAYDARNVARRPAVPRKLFAAALTGLGTAAAAWRIEPGLLAPAVYGAAAGVLHVAAFGTDPLRDKGLGGIDDFQNRRVARAVDQAENHLSDMADAISRAGDRELEARVERFQTTARHLFRTVEEDPRDLTAARKYLSVYLLGARDATVKFADLYSRRRDPEARRDYLRLLDDLEQNFAARTEKMLLDDRSDLTVEIDVLRERLQREGIRPAPPETEENANV
ncbi:5-bromo-4-chloroindolyl phosphate hydrolysis family protein [Roseovarius salinarum]|uniref:5-bromo-4-chloroindolyl phosphate hydrolysis family protein n=1 Tax=Roseovarius salinarum TaxID=1981892 RepID=UPI000C31C446|nr:5-bromo-4-chloroindolyl phosphate hydrolysis family protein [Roseovarius salinarum]